jgi:hypothetical protein
MSAALLMITVLFTCTAAKVNGSVPSCTRSEFVVPIYELEELEWVRRPRKPVRCCVERQFRKCCHQSSNRLNLGRRSSVASF